MKQNSNNMDMTEGAIGPKMLLLSVPLIFTNLLQIVFSLADVAVVGQCCGSEALGSVGCTVIAINLFTGILIGAGNGVNVLTARFVGAKDNKAVEETVHTGVLLTLLMGIVVMVGCILFTRPLLELLNTKPELIAGAELYMKLYFLSMPAIAIYNCGNGILSAIGDTKSPLFYLLIAGVVNVFLNLGFVLLLGMDVDGVALASVISQYLSAALILNKLFRTKEVFGLCFQKLRLKKLRILQILKLGIPTGLQYAIFQVANLFIQASVNSFDAVVVEGISAAANVDPVIYDVMAAFYTACASFIGQNFGAGRMDRVKRSYCLGVLYSFAAGLILGTVFFFFGRPFLFLFTKDAAVVDAGMQKVRIMAFLYGISAFMDCSLAASRGLGKTVIPMIEVLLGSCVFRIIWIKTIFAHYHTIESLYLLYLFSWAITAIAEIIYFIYIYRKTAGTVGRGKKNESSV